MRYLISICERPDDSLFPKFATRKMHLPPRIEFSKTILKKYVEGSQKHKLGQQACQVGF